MQTLMIDGVKAKKLFPNATPEFKEMLKDSFGERFFSDKITDRIETFEDVVQVAIELGYIKEWRNKSEDETIDEYAYRQLKLISKVLNEGWEPDWSDYSQYKYYPWFGHKSGVGLSYDDCVGWHSHTYVGSSLCYKSAELAKFAGKQFENIYRDFLTINK